MVDKINERQRIILELPVVDGEQVGRPRFPDGWQEGQNGLGKDAVPRERPLEHEPGHSAISILEGMYDQKVYHRGHGEMERGKL